MLHQISWRAYLWTVVIAIIIFYVCLFLFYYRKEYKQFFKNLQQGKLRFSAGEEEGSDAVNSLQGLLQELNDFFIAVDRQTNKDELTESLRVKLSAYGSQLDRTHQSKINTYIINESRKLCSIHLSEEDLRVLWE